VFKVGDMVVCVDAKTDYRTTFKLIQGKLYKILYVDDYHITIVESKHCRWNLTRFELALKNNKLNRKLYPNYKIEGKFLIKENYE